MLLALDTSTPETALALADEGRVLATLVARAPGRLEDGLLPLIERLLLTAGRDRKELATLAVGLGPGGYTSLRIGISTVKGLAVGFGAKLVGVGSLRLIARGIGSEHAVAATFVDARRGEVYGAAYAVAGAHTVELAAPVHGSVADVAAYVRARVGGAACRVAGDALGVYPELFGLLGPSFARAPSVYDAPRPEALVLEAWSAMSRGDYAPLDGLEPHYVKPSDAKLPLRPLRTSLGPGID